MTGRREPNPLLANLPGRLVTVQGEASKRLWPQLDESVGVLRLLNDRAPKSRRRSQDEPMMSLVALGLTGVCLCTAWRLTVLFRRGAAARIAQDRQVWRWRDVTGLGKDVRSGNVDWLALLRDWAVRPQWFPASRYRPAAFRKAIFFDPVDGTRVSPGETVVRCGCGGVYHTHSGNG